MNRYTKSSSTLAMLALALPAICQAQAPATAYVEITVMKNTGQTSAALKMCEQIIKFFSNKNSRVVGQFAHMLPFFYSRKAELYQGSVVLSAAFNAYEKLANYKELSTASMISAARRTDSLDARLSIPSAVSAKDLADAKGCIVVNIFNDLDKMSDAKAKRAFLKSYPKANIWWSVGDKTPGYTVDEASLLTEFIMEQKEMHIANDIPEEKVRLYLRGDKDVPWERTAGAIRAAAAAGVSNIIFGTNPAVVK